MMTENLLLVEMIIRYVSRFSFFFLWLVIVFCLHITESLQMAPLATNICYQLLVWNQHSQQPILRLTEHTAAVKAIAWSPHQHGLLASGGGTADRCIRFWNTANSNQLNFFDTGSQVIFHFSKHLRESVSIHFFLKDVYLGFHTSIFTGLQSSMV